MVMTIHKYFSFASEKCSYLICFEEFQASVLMTMRACILSVGTLHNPSNQVSVYGTQTCDFLFAGTFFAQCMLLMQWFLEGVLDLVKDLDPEMPYFVTGTIGRLHRLLHATLCSVLFTVTWTSLQLVCATDNLWWSSVNNTIGYQPNLEAPRCLPCGFSKYGKPYQQFPQYSSQIPCSAMQLLDLFWHILLVWAMA